MADKDLVGDLGKKARKEVEIFWYRESKLSPHSMTLLRSFIVKRKRSFDDP